MVLRDVAPGVWCPGDSCLLFPPAGMERGDGTSCLNVCSCGRGDTSRSGDTTGAVGHMPRHSLFVGALALAGEAQRTRVLTACMLKVVTA